jgi:hypothetical protein
MLQVSPQVENGGAATYVAEHMRKTKRILDFLDSTATVGLFISLMVILAKKHS